MTWYSFLYRMKFPWIILMEKALRIVGIICAIHTGNAIAWLKEKAALHYTVIHLI